MNRHLRELLITMADRLTHDPDRDPKTAFTPVDRRALARQLTDGDDAALLDLLPRIVEPTTRSAYAARLRKIASVR